MSEGVCNRCGGKGKTWDGAALQPCWYCDGTGSIPLTGRKQGAAPRKSR